MKTVKLVDVTVKEVPFVSYGEIRYYCMQDSPLVPFKDGALVCDEVVKYKVVPVTHFYKNGSLDVAIAYTEELENILGIPVKAILAERDYAEHKYKEASRLATDNKAWANRELNKRIKILEKYLTASFLKRLKYLFTGEL